MKVLVATTETQGQRENDFNWTKEEELVYFGSECTRESVDGACGCKRAMAGMETHKATTTMKIVDMDLTADEFRQKALTALQDAGWAATPATIADRAAASDMADELIGIAESFPAGSIVERRGPDFGARFLGMES